MDRFRPASPSGHGRAAPHATSDRRERQIVRVLALLRVLSQGRNPSVHELAVQFRTRRETIYRDLRVLQDAGYPIAGDDRGFLSRPRLLSSNVPSICFTPGELDALRVAMKQVQVSLPDDKTLANANTKLQALLESEPHVQPFVGDYLETWTCGVKQFHDHHAHTTQLVEAILRRRRCHVTYRKPSSVQAKGFDFHPYRLLLVGGGLYVIGNVPKYDNLATLAIDRLISVALDSVEFAVSRLRSQEMSGSGIRRQLGQSATHCAPLSSRSGSVRSRKDLASNPAVQVFAPWVAGDELPCWRTIRNSPLDPRLGRRRRSHLA